MMGLENNIKMIKFGKMVIVIKVFIKKYVFRGC
jgi:hypothetical protein